MVKKKISLATCLLTLSLLGTGLYGQESRSIKEVDSALAAYFELPRESLFLHLNKSTYISGEQLWFSGYVYDRQQKLPFEATENVYVGIYDAKGKQLSKKLFRAQGGYLKGSLELDSTLQAGNFYLKANTHWMGNFEESDAYIQPFELLSADSEIKTSGSSKPYEVHFLPEGGHLVNEVAAVVGVKLMDAKGMGVPGQGIIMNEKGEQVTVFKTSAMGIGKFNFTPSKSTNYRILMSFPDGTEKTLTAPEIRDEGLGLMLSNLLAKNQVVFSVSTNSETQKKLKGQTFYALIHSDGNAEKIDFNFSQELSHVFSLPLADFPTGVNTITIFSQEGVPLLERLFFNASKLTTGNPVGLSLVASKPDSLQFRLKVQTADEEFGKLSVSVLPQGNLSYRHPDNILSTFYLKPYVRGIIERPGYYFREMDSRKIHELDALLLTQGWSRYHWDSIFEASPTSEKVFERGTTLRLAFQENSNDKRERVLLHRTRNQAEQILEIPEDVQELMISEFFPEREESIFLSLVDANDKLRKPKLFASILDNNIEDRISPIPKSIGTIAPTVIQYENPKPPLILENKTVRLDEVVLEGTREITDPKTNPNIPAFLKNRVIRVDQDLAIKYPEFLDIVRSKGYNVQRLVEGVSIRSYRDGRIPLIYLDGVQIRDLNWLAQLQTTQLESFFIDKIGAREGVRGGLGEVIYIYTRRGKQLDLGRGVALRKKAYEFKAKKGFEPRKAYFSPKYTSYADEAFTNYGVVHWLPDIVTDANGVSTFRIPNQNVDRLTFYVEGMGNKGSLWSFSKDLGVTDKEFEKP